MSEELSDSEQEQYAYKVTRKLFWWTLGGTILFSATMIVLSVYF